MHSEFVCQVHSFKMNFVQIRFPRELSMEIFQGNTGVLKHGRLKN